MTITKRALSSRVLIDVHPHSNWLSFRSTDLCHSCKDLGEQKHSTKCKMLLFYLLGVDDITIHVYAMALHCLKRFLYHFGKEGLFPMVWNTLQPQFHLGAKKKKKGSKYPRPSYHLQSLQLKREGNITEPVYQHAMTCSHLIRRERERERPANGG